jgi:transmembrane sensor
MTSRSPTSRDVERRASAAEWLLRLQEPTLDEDAVAEWMAWCEADPLNRTAFEGATEVHDLAGLLDRASFDDAEPQASADRPGARARGFERPRIWAWGAMAASIVLAGLVAIALPSAMKPPREQAAHASASARLETARGMHQAVRLDDGSRVQLGGHSALSVRYSPQTRLIVADSGEAFFNVAHNRERPFVVEAGPLTITAVGTAFSVEREGNSVAVAVTEGVVEVRAAPSLKAGADQADDPAAQPVVLRVSAGHRIRFDRGELTQSVERVDPETAASWGQGRLEFQDEPLRLVVARINRYSAQQLQISDPSIEDLRVTGTVYSDRIDAWLAGIEVVLPVRVTHVAAGHVVISPAIGGPVKAAR